MKKHNNKDWQTMFGDAPDAFEDRVTQTVRRMERGRQTAAKPRWIPVLATMLILLGSVALALGGLGILDQMGEGLRAFLQPGAQKLVQSEINQQGGVMALATFEAVEAINDGRQVYLMLRIHANDPAAVLLMDGQHEPAEDMPGGDITFSKAAYDSGRDLVQVSVWPHEDALELSAMTVDYDGEDILYTLSLLMPESPVEDVTLDIATHNLYRDDQSWEEKYTRGEMTVSIPVTDTRETYTANTPIDLPDAGLILHALRLEKTPIATYVTVRFSLMEEATPQQALSLRSGIWFNWLDEDGNCMPDGRMSQSQNANFETVELTTAYRAFDQLPEEITLEFYSGMSKERFDPITVPIHKEGETK